MKLIHVSYQHITGSCLKLALDHLPEEQRQVVVHRIARTGHAFVCPQTARIHLFEGKDFARFNKRLKELTPPQKGEYIIQLIGTVEDAESVA